jgi:hypothetical protein
MRIKVQTCWTGHGFCFCALIGGGIRIRSEDGIWTRRDATEMISVLRAEGITANRFRFIHV